MTPSKVLCVDDEVNVLKGLRRQLAGKYKIEVAEGGEAGLEVIKKKGPFAVVISDMRMPKMDGVQFLTKVREMSPDIVRMVLTGHADMQAAIDAVNKGHIFRFLTKPCAPELLGEAIDAGIAQFRLITVERDLLRDTLTGSMKVLTDIVAMLNPVAFGRAGRIRRFVKHIAEQLELSDVWEFELAGTLSQIGCIALPTELVERASKQEPLDPEEQKVYAVHPEIARKLVENIPRLGRIAEIIGRQQESYWAGEASEDMQEWGRADLGSHILAVAIDLDALLMRGMNFPAAWRKLAARTGDYNPDVLDALMDLKIDEDAEETRELTVGELRMGMLIEEDVLANDNTILVGRGQEVTYPVLIRLRNASNTIGVIEPIKVRIGDWCSEATKKQQRVRV